MWVDIHAVGPHTYILSFLQSFSIQYMMLSEMRTKSGNNSMEPPLAPKFRLRRNPYTFVFVP